MDNLSILLQQFSGCGESTRNMNQGAARGCGATTIMAGGKRRRMAACGCDTSNQGAARGCGAITIMASEERRFRSVRWRRTMSSKGLASEECNNEERQEASEAAAELSILWQVKSAGGE